MLGKNVLYTDASGTQRAGVVVNVRSSGNVDISYYSGPMPPPGGPTFPVAFVGAANVPMGTGSNTYQTI